MNGLFYLKHLELTVPGNGKWRRQWHPTPVLLPGKSHGRRCLVGCSPWGHEESDTTEWLHFHFPLSCIGEGNGNPLQCSCLENPRDGGAWWAAISGIAQSRTRLKRLSSSSSISCYAKMQMNFLIDPIHEYGIKKSPTKGTKDMFKSIILFMRNYEIITC